MIREANCTMEHSLKRTTLILRNKDKNNDIGADGVREGSSGVLRRPICAAKWSSATNVVVIFVAKLSTIKILID